MYALESYIYAFTYSNRLFTRSELYCRVPSNIEISWFLNASRLAYYLRMSENSKNNRKCAYIICGYFCSYLA